MEDNLVSSTPHHLSGIQILKALGRSSINEQVTELQALKLLLQSTSPPRGGNSSSGLVALHALCLVLVCVHY